MSLICIYEIVNTLVKLNFMIVESTTKVYGPPDLIKRSIPQQPVGVASESACDNVVGIF